MRERSDVFIGGAVRFGFQRGEDEASVVVPVGLVLDLLVLLRWLVLVYGTEEVTFARLFIRGALAATFELTYPGIEDS